MDERCDLLCVDAPGAEAIRKGLLGVEAARDAAERARVVAESNEDGCCDDGCCD